jgi:branched-subunit amino acid transport protein
MEIWLLFVIIGAATFAMRFIPIALAGRPLPPLMLRALRYVPPAVLSAIFVPDMLLRKGNLDLSPSNGRLLAGLLAIVVAYLSKNVIVTIFAGMVCLWVLLALGAH